MTKKWRVVAGERGWCFEAFRDNNLIAIGWPQLGDISGISNMEELRKKYEEGYPEETKMQVSMGVAQVWKFKDEMKKGDKVAVYGAGKILLGEITGEYDFKEEEDVFEHFVHRREVVWISPELFVDGLPEEARRRFLYRWQTITELDEDLWLELEKLSKGIVEKAEVPKEEYVSVSLEEDLRKYLARCPEVLEKGLELVEDRSTPAGQLDLLFRDEKGDYVVVETKRRSSSDAVVGQLLRYIAGVREKYGKNVRGIIVLYEPDKKLEYSVKGAGNIGIKYYRMRFEINDRPFE